MDENDEEYKAFMTDKLPAPHYRTRSRCVATAGRKDWSVLICVSVKLLECRRLKI